MFAGRKNNNNNNHFYGILKMFHSVANKLNIEIK